MSKKTAETNDLRKTLSLNVKRQRKIMGLTQEKLAEAANLSHQTINDIEGCRMWVSDKTILKLAQIFHIDAYQLLAPVLPEKPQAALKNKKNDLLTDLEGRIIRMVNRQFEEAIIQNL